MVTLVCAGSIRTWVGGFLLALFLVGTLTVTAALTFSAKVQGHSMDPTLADGDRVFLQFWGRDQIKRFDLVEADFLVSGNNGTRRAVKRVVGLPGDTVSITVTAGKPVVPVRPAGSDAGFVVDNPAWDGQYGAQANELCCARTGTTTPESKTHKVTVPNESYWLIGDNWGGSDDSRAYGFVTADKIFGRLNFRILPLSDFGSVQGGVSLVPEK